MIWNIIGAWLSFNALVVATLHVASEKAHDRRLATERGR